MRCSVLVEELSDGRLLFLDFEDGESAMVFIAGKDREYSVITMAFGVLLEEGVAGD